VKVFTDISLNFNKTDYIATLPEAWKDEGCFVAANAAAFLYQRFGEVGLSFFPDYVRKQVKAQGWNKEEDRPVQGFGHDENVLLQQNGGYSPQTRSSEPRSMPGQEFSRQGLHSKSPKTRI
jgi:hypothetical protein